MKLVYKRSSTSTATAASTALAEPEEAYAPATVPEPTPAPVGALHRGPSQEPQPLDLPTEDDYQPQRGSYRMRLRGGLPRSIAGRVLVSAGALSILGIVTLAVAGTRQFLLHDPRFTLTTASEIAVEGNAHISRGDVLGVFGADLERNIFRVPLDERRADLERLPWVAHATIERLLPHQLRVRVLERTPIAFVRQGSHIGLVDADGVLLDMPPESAGDPHYSFPVLTGLAPNDTPEERTARMEVYRRFMAGLDSGGERRTQALSEVDVSNPEDVKALVTLDGADVLVHFGDEDFLKRFGAFQQHLPEWRTQYPKLAAADMRYERQVVLEMQGNVTPLTSEGPLPPDAGVKPAPVSPANHMQPKRQAVDARRAHALAAHRAAEHARMRSGERR